MRGNAGTYVRRSIRLPQYDYATAGAYFVTVCAHKYHCLFGEIEDGTLVLNEWGQMVDECWRGIPEHYPAIGANNDSPVRLDEYIIMPNHIHGIIMIGDGISKNQSHHLPQSNPPRGTSKTIGAMIRGFKIGVTKGARRHIAKSSIGQRTGESSFAPIWQGESLHGGQASFAPKSSSIWHRNYYEHIIRDERSLRTIREYIINNPRKWHKDKYNVRANHHSPSNVGANSGATGRHHSPK